MSVGTVPAAMAVADRRLATRILRDEPALLSSLDVSPNVRQGIGDGPALFIGDQVGIQLFTPATVGCLDHRMALLASPGDVVVVRQREYAFEAYLKRCLGLDSVSFIEARGRDPMPVAAQCRCNASLRAHLLTALDDSPSITIQPYLCNGHVWRLAGDLADELGHSVYVAGPGLRTCRRTNDKTWFWQLVRELLGGDAVPPTLLAFGPAAAAAEVARILKSSEKVVVKVPASAGGIGNVRMDRELLAGMRLADIRSLLIDRLTATGWAGSYPVLVGVWESGIIHSPSAQLWIPHIDAGPPMLLGIFEQRLEGTEGTFIGARRACFEPSIEARIIEQSIRIGAVLQRIGYFGPCSLDAVLRRQQAGVTDLHWIECNGRWSGVALPLAATTRLYGSSPPGLLIVQEERPGLAELSIPWLERRFGKLLFVRGTTRDGLVILAPPAQHDSATLALAALADNETRAEKLIESARKRLGISR